MQTAPHSTPAPPALPVPDPSHGADIARVLQATTGRFPWRPQFREFRGALGAYIDEGPKDAPVLLCLHGNPTWSFFYRAVVERFAGAYRVVVPDHIGMGLSEKPQDFDYTLATRIAAMEDLIQHLDLRRITLLVHDWGGAIGVGLAGRHPERFERLVASNTAAFPGFQAHSLIRIARLPGLHQLLMGRLGLFEKITVRWATGAGLAPDLRKAYLAPFPSPEARVAVRAFVRDIPLRAAHPSYATLLEVERSLAMWRDKPVLLLWGNRDWVFTPAFREEFARRLPTARVCGLDHCGHLLWEDDPARCLDEVAQLLEVQA
ncbi:MAG: alpha/beta fold hydrolase [Planctomycetota bacterium]